MLMSALCVAHTTGPKARHPRLAASGEEGKGVEIERELIQRVTRSITVYRL
jgi:hypothetical protein